MAAPTPAFHPLDATSAEALCALVPAYAPSAVLITDEAQRILYANAAFERMTGYTLAEVLGQWPGPLLQGPATDDAARLALRRAVAQRQPVTVELVNYRKDGTPFWAEIDLVPLGDDAPGGARFLALQQEISARRASSDRLRAREAELQSVFESITEHAVLLLDVRGVVQRCNHAATVMSGWPLPALKGRPIYELKSGRGMRVRFQRLLRAAATAKCTGTTRLLRRDGTRYWAKWSLTAMRAEDGGIDGFVLVAQDVSQEVSDKRAREVARQHAEELARSKSTFLANMSHEIRTPLNGVLGLARLLLEEPLTERQRRMATTLLGSGEALLTVVNDVLDFSKLEAGKLSLALAPTATADIVRGVVSILDVGARTKGIRLSAEIADDVPPYVLMDAGRLRQVLLNLAGNAVKFTEKGRVSIHVSHVVEPSGTTMLTFAVRDTGIGIKPEHLSRLFRMFEQVDGSASRRATGTGLGLAISLSIAELMGGRIDVESTYGEGSCFTLMVPSRVAEPVAPDAPQIVRTRRFAGRRVLVAEDNPVNQMVAKMMLERFGCIVQIAADGAEALHAISEMDWDLVLMDGSMPELDGYEVTQRVRASEGLRSRRTVIVACSASAFPEDRRRALEAGMDDVLPKPIAPESLAQILDKWLPDDELDAEEIAEAASVTLPPPPAPVHVLDPLRVEALRRLDESGVAVAKITAAFTAAGPQRVQRLREAIGRGDVLEVERTAHGLRGAAAQVGAVVVEELARSIEDAAHSADELSLYAMLTTVERALAEASQALEYASAA